MHYTHFKPEDEREIRNQEDLMDENERLEAELLDAQVALQNTRHLLHDKKVEIGFLYFLIVAILAVMFVVI